MLPNQFSLLMLRLFAVLRDYTSTQDGSLQPRLVYRSKGHLIIGALFPIHRQGQNCRRIWPEYGIQRMEMAMKTVAEINANDTILPGIQLGLEIRDSCWTEKVAVEQTIQLLRGVMDPGGDRTCPKGAKSPQNEMDEKNIVAVVGPGSSDNSKAVHNLLQIFSIPQIGYSATSVDLSNKHNYRYYMRVVPSDDWQAKAFVDIVKHFNWTYVGVIYSEGSYGQKGFDELIRLDKEDKNWCIGRKETLKRDFVAEDYEKLVSQVLEDSQSPKVFICFCLGDDVRMILSALNSIERTDNASNPFQLIGSESWGDREDVVRRAQSVAAGSFSLRIHSPDKVDFDHYFLNLPYNHSNPWWTEFWEQQFECSRQQGHAVSADLLPCGKIYSLFTCNHRTRLTSTTTS